MTGLGQSRHFDRAPLTSGLRLADILGGSRHVSKADIGVIVVRQFFDPGAAEQRTMLQA
jgi:hypothetical protein